MLNPKGRTSAAPRGGSPVISYPRCRQLCAGSKPLPRSGVISTEPLPDRQMSLLKPSALEDLFAGSSPRRIGWNLASRQQSCIRILLNIESLFAGVGDNRAGSVDRRPMWSVSSWQPSTTPDRILLRCRSSGPFLFGFLGHGALEVTPHPTSKPETK